MTLDPLVVFGAIGSILGAVVTTGIRGTWVFGRELAAAKATCSEVAEDRDFWRDFALKSLTTADRAVTVATKASRDA